MKTIALLGSTGSIGENTLRVVNRLEGRLRVAALDEWHKRDVPELGRVLRDMRRFHDQVWKRDGVSFRYKLKPTVPTS